MEFNAEVREGSLILISSAVEKVSTSSLTARHRMTDAESRELLSTMRSVTVYFDLQLRRAMKLPGHMRYNAESRIVDKSEIGE